MRAGSNPFKRAKIVNSPSPVTVALLAHIPFEHGYFRESLDVLKLCLQSIYANTTAISYDILVFDNGSARPVVDFLINEQREGRIQYLALSGTNIGKAAALNFMLGAAPGEYIAYSDSDVFFFPGWLEAHIKILETFPRVGIVNGLPARHLTDWATESTLAIARESPDIQIETGQLIPSDIIASRCEGVGRQLEDDVQEYGALEDIRLTCNEVQAYVGAHHFQFVARKNVLQKIGPLQVTAPLHNRDDRQFDQALDAAGYMRLAAASQYVFHLGNVLTPKWRQVAEEYAVPVRPVSQVSGSVAGMQRLKHRMREHPAVKRVLLKLYGGIFDLYYGGRKHEF